MKKIIALFLSLALIGGMVAYGYDREERDYSITSSTAEESEVLDSHIELENPEKAYSKAQFNLDWKKAKDTLKTGQIEVVIQAQGFSIIEKEVLDFAYQNGITSGVIVKFWFDETEDNNIANRIYVTAQAENRTIDIRVNEQEYKKVNNIFLNYYKNTTLVLAYDRTGSLMTIATKLPKGIDRFDLRVYSYNAVRNEYKPIKNLDTWVDSNDYLYFTAEQGYIVITSGDFIRR